ncbi:hypothetical protein [Glutamicibacter sp.]|uniref:hypothetical protein n=1 Tax=Glutamicibacter sp. TaxID=1931995 RepID=UPI003D6A5D2D
MARRQLISIEDPFLVMDPRNLGAMQPNRLSASRSFIAKMIREQWKIEREVFDVDIRGNGQARYSVSTPNGSLTFLAFMQEPSGENRTGRIIGTSWDMVGALLDGVATADDVKKTSEELPRLYEGRATSNTLVWFRSNQSLRIFREVREALAHGRQPDTDALRKVGYLMRNTGLDGNGTFGTMPFAAIPENHPLKTSYHAQMLSAYLMRELSVDLVEELAKLDAPGTAAQLVPSVKRQIGVGNGSALGLAMLFYNRPIMVNAYISAYLKVIDHVLADQALDTSGTYQQLEQHLNRAITYRSFLKTSYRFFTSNMEIVGDLRRIRAKVRAAARGEFSGLEGETSLGRIYREAITQASKEALHSFGTLLLELAPDYCDSVAREELQFDEQLALDPTAPVAVLADLVESRYRWALDFPLNDKQHADRVWYQSRAAEEPRSGPREEVPEAHELVQNYPLQIRSLWHAIKSLTEIDTVGKLVEVKPELEYIARLVMALQQRPYATSYVDPHDADFVPVWVIRFVNSFIHGLDRTEDHMGRDVRGLIFESAPYREELPTADAATWWWNYEKPAVPAALVASVHPALQASEAPRAKPVQSVLTPIQTPLDPPAAHATEFIDMKFRELRLMAGRAYQALNLPEGSWQGAREFVAVAIAADFDCADAYGDLLIRSIDGQSGTAQPWLPPITVSRGHEITIDNREQSLLLTGHLLVNILGGRATRTPVRVRIENATSDHAVAGIQLELKRYGVEFEVAESGESISGSVSASAKPDELKTQYAEIKEQFLEQGQRVSARTFWNIYYRASAGLDVDTPISRQHTGGTVLEVLRPGEQITKQFSLEELQLLSDPDDMDNQNLAEILANR